MEANKTSHIQEEKVQEINVVRDSELESVLGSEYDWEYQSVDE